jgi:hypothetical protein
VAAVIRRVGDPELATFDRLIKGRNGANLSLALSGVADRGSDSKLPRNMVLLFCRSCGPAETESVCDYCLVNNPQASKRVVLPLICCSAAPRSHRANQSFGVIAEADTSLHQLVYRL